ncbi:MAG: Fe2+-dependent dioxygenase [Alphaproteobacteria bacterium]
MLKCVHGLLEPAAVQTLLGIAEKGEMVDGRSTAGKLLHQAKKNQQLKPTTEQRNQIVSIVTKAIEGSDEFKNFALPKRILPPTINRYEPGMEYGSHIDNPIMGGTNHIRSDLSMTIFLSPPDSYDGGELVMDTPMGEQEIKLLSGDAVVYATMLRHRVKPVTRGVRIAAVTWMQSFIKDPLQREIIHDLDIARRALRDRDPDSEEYKRLLTASSNLFKMWADV